MKLKLVTMWICEACLNGEGKECHTPGCALWLHRVDLPVDRRLYKVVQETEEEEAPDGHEKAKEKHEGDDEGE